MKAGSPRVVIRSSERARIVDELEGVLAHLEVVEEHLVVAAARSGTNLSAWTERRLDAIREAASELRGSVVAAPVGGD